MTFCTRFALLATTLCALAACVEQEMPEASEGAALYAENCAICHGPLARGDGPIAAGLSPKPSDLTKITRRAGDTFPRAAVLSKIDGYTKQPKDAQMPEFGLLLRGATVPVDVGGNQPSPVPRPLAALLAYLETIQR
ncbi:MAG TPA: cytochrome C [Rhodobacteraceae bacterium]|jgi:mono/diheme cytochrome c family protein|nr:cytochrome C [Paracoccaceae bacterium]